MPGSVEPGPADGTAAASHDGGSQAGRPGKEPEKWPRSLVRIGNGPDVALCRRNLEVFRGGGQSRRPTRPDRPDETSVPFLHLRPAAGAGAPGAERRCVVFGAGRHLPRPNGKASRIFPYVRAIVRPVLTFRGLRATPGPSQLSACENTAPRCQLDGWPRPGTDHADRPGQTGPRPRYPSCTCALPTGLAHRAPSAERRCVALGQVDISAVRAPRRL